MSISCLKRPPDDSTYGLESVADSDSFRVIHRHMDGVIQDLVCSQVLRRGSRDLNHDLWNANFLVPDDLSGL